MKVDSDMKRVIDFQDFNYERIAFDTNYMFSCDRDELKKKLKCDFINKLYRMNEGYYFAIWNSDYQNFKNIDDIYFDSDKRDYKLASLYLFDGKWYYRVVEERRVNEDHCLV